MWERLDQGIYTKRMKEFVKVNLSFYNKSFNSPHSNSMPPIQLKTGGKCWKISTEEKNWLDAALSCCADNSILASVTNKEDQEKVHQNQFENSYTNILYNALDECNA